MRPRTVLRLTHLWVGLVLSLLLVVLGVTGSALVYKEAYWRLVYPELREAPAGLEATDHAAAIRTAHERFGEVLRSVKLPEPGVGAYHLYLDDGEAFLSAMDHSVIDRWRPGERAMGFLFDLHAHLMAGEMGERVGGVVALLGVFLVITGVILWWPARKRFNVRGLWPTELSRRSLLPSHRDLGLVTTPLLLVLLVTGGGIVFYGAAGWVLNGLLPGPAPLSEEAPEVAAARSVPPANARLLATVEDAFPDARLVFYYPPRNGSGLHGFRLKRPCEMHPNGRSYVYADAGGQVLKTIDACRQPPGQRALHSVYPLHSAKTESGAYKLAAFLGGLVLTMISATGAASYLTKLRKKSSASRSPLVRPPVPH